MSRKFNSGLSLEPLEPRDTPNATVSFANSTIYITGDATPNNVVINEVAPGQFAVTVNAAAKGTFAARNISAVMGGANDTVDLGVNSTLPGGVYVSLGGGNDSFTTKNSTIGAKIVGNVTVNTGLGPVFVGNYDEVVELYNLSFIGPAVTVNGTGGARTTQLDMQSAFVSGTLVARNIYEAALGLPGDASGAVTINTLFIDNTYLNTDSRADGPAGAGNAVFMYSGTAISHNFLYYGGSGRDDIDLPGDFPNAVADVTIGGNLTVWARGGTNTLALGNGQGFGVHIGGNVFFHALGGVDRFFFDSGSTVGGNVTAYLNQGNDQVFGDSIGLGAGPYDPIGNATVGGFMAIFLGEGVNFVGTYDAANGASLTVGGNLKIFADGGNNLGGAAATPGAITFFNDRITVGGTAVYSAGVGSQVLEVRNAHLADLRFYFLGGANTVNFLVPTFFGNVFINYGIGPGPKLFETDVTPTTFIGRLTIYNLH